MSGHAKSFKVKDGDEDKNSKLMFTVWEVIRKI